jgi:hypothetical protein
MILEELRARATDTSDGLWWTYRFLDEVMDLREEAAPEDVAFAVDCFLRLSLRDPAWTTKVLGDRGARGHGFATLLSAERLTAALSKLHLPNIKDDAMLRAQVLCTAARWQRDDARRQTWQRAWEELMRVPEAERDASWADLALEPTAFADYPCYRTLATLRLASMTDNFWRSDFLPKALAVAARHRDWSAFDTWLDAWRSLPEQMTQGHDACAVLNLEGLRALENGRAEDAETAMRRLLDVAQGQPFLSNDETSALPKRLRAAGISADLCDAFDDLVKRLDWRLLIRR